jgi:hypothetical protein
MKHDVPGNGSPLTWGTIIFAVIFIALLHFGGLV